MYSAGVLDGTEFTLNDAFSKFFKDGEWQHGEYDDEAYYVTFSGMC